MTKKKVKKLKLKRIFCCLLILVLIIILVVVYINTPIKNIYIINNNITSDNEILELANIKNYPPFISTSRNKIKKELLKNKYIKDVKITKTLGFKLYIDIIEYKVLAIDLNGKLILENGQKIDNFYNITSAPYLVNEVDTAVYDRFVTKFNLIEDDILLKISQIEYSPVDVDKERFLLYMNDNNYVYVTLTKIKKLNKYEEISEQLEGKNGIVYLDSGDYVEIK